LAGLATFGLPLAVLSWTAASPPEVKVVSNNGRLSAFIVSDGLRLLALTEVDPREVQWLLGNVRRPWEAGPSTLAVSAANDPRASGLWAALQQTDVKQVIVVGLPGADPTWTAVERHCEQHGIRLDYVAARATIDAEDMLLVLLHGDEQAGGDSLLLRSGQLNIAIALDSSYPSDAAGIVIANGAPSAEVPQPDLLIRSEWLTQPLPQTTELALGRSGTVSLLLEDDRVRVRGGSPRQANSGTAVP
jgi:hypothetical protein